MDQWIATDVPHHWGPAPEKMTVVAVTKGQPQWVGEGHRLQDEALRGAGVMVFCGPGG